MYTADVLIQGTLPVFTQFMARPDVYWGAFGAAFLDSAVSTSLLCTGAPSTLQQAEGDVVLLLWGTAKWGLGGEGRVG